MREVKEETGYDVQVETITSTYTNPRHVMAYDDGEVRQQFSIAFRARLIGGLHPSMRLRLAHALQDSDRPHIG